MSAADLETFKKKAEPAVMADFKTKTSRGIIDAWVKAYNNADSGPKKEFSNFMKSYCDKFYETEEYKSGDTTYFGYGLCCEALGLCGGMAWWAVLLIIFIILGMCASGAAAFWFFYWNRKRGGHEEKVEEDDKENTESTDNQKSDIEIPIGTY